ncbi:N-terminal domain of peptidoglycan hydrolase CwlO-containing protein [Bhargavaea ginsengi]|uniref:N-terminal domain of peptidoglycan hydrolase CwlO-containing protein n=1 Tax=Bhargavaea ginsengi TaxID=426757 RepID=A0A1H7A8I6_9BACL|nr:M23 family metallopeptidase [Bhargavaea ginsengi]SEJ61949.1 N-terminal domain of peptidoglycan hydrolase CwlO-containing protein [Bhargavaea ginsengi]
MKQSKPLIATVAATMALSFGLGTTGVSASKLNDLQNQQQQIEQKKNELNRGIQEKASNIKANSEKMDKLLAQIKDLHGKIETKQNEIAQLEQEIEVTKAEIEALRASIKELEQKIADRDALLRDRIRAMQVTGGSTSYIDVLLGASSFSDFIDRVSAVNTLREADRQIIAEQKADKATLEDQKKQVEDKLASQEENKKKLEAAKAELDRQKQELDGLISQLEAEQQRLEKEQSSLQAEYSEAHEMSSELTQQIVAEQERLAEIARKAEEERKRKEAEARKQAAAAAASKQAESNRKAAASSGSSVGYTSAPAPAVSGGTWTRPASGRITSTFGYRNLSWASSNHQGVDIANATGTTIVAAGNGIVSSTGSHRTLGNYIMITHSVNGQTMTTVYGHLSSINTSKGAQVSKGQMIGRMGSTGRSSGPHLHFEVHIGTYGNPVNPMRYVPL